MLRQALDECEDEIPDRADLEANLERALKVQDPNEQEAEYRRFMDLLIEAPDQTSQESTLMVFSDWLQSIDDPRGALIAVQRERADARGERLEELYSQERHLLAVHKKQLLPDHAYGRLVWRSGFVHRLEINDLEGLLRARLEALFAHPSMLLLEELSLQLPHDPNVSVVPNLPTPPRTLRALEIGADPVLRVGALGEYIQTAPRLERVSVHVGRLVLSELAHPTLQALELSATHADSQTGLESWLKLEPQETLTAQLADLERKKLPAVQRLALTARYGLDSACVSLAAGDLLPGLSQLELSGQLGTRGITALAGELSKPLDKILIQGALLGPESLAALRRACKELVIQARLTEEAPAEKKPWQEDRKVLHKRRPAWGTGRVLDETDDYTEVEFEHAGIKRIRAPELLEDI